MRYLKYLLYFSIAIFLTYRIWYLFWGNGFKHYPVKRFTISQVSSGEFSEWIPQTGTYDTSKHLLIIPIDELYLNRIKVGLTGTTRINNADYSLEITDVHPEVVNGRFFADLKFSDSLPTFHNDQSIRVRIMLSGTKQALLVPLGGFYRDTGGEWIFKVKGNRAIKQRTKLGRRNTEHFEVLEGLNVGDTVITSSYENWLELGDEVELSELEETME